LKKLSGLLLNPFFKQGSKYRSKIGKVEPRVRKATPA
jgi:hypothetical protein